MSLLSQGTRLTTSRGIKAYDPTPTPAVTKRLGVSGPGEVRSPGVDRHQVGVDEFEALEANVELSEGAQVVVVDAPMSCQAAFGVTARGSGP